MKRALTFFAWSLALVSLMLVASCASSGVNQGDLNLISLQEEWELGEQIEGDVNQKVELVRDRQLEGFVSQLGRRIVAQTELADLPWEFHVVADPAVNAFNIPGGHVYVNTGLIEAAGDVTELAGVMAHEIAHGVARHGTEQLTKSYGLSLLAGVALGEDPGTAERLAAQFLGGGALAKFSRDAEREADSLGVRYMARAGYDPLGMARMFEELLRRRQRQPSSVEQFFSSHPLTEDRIQEVRAEARRLGGSYTNPSSGFQTARNRAARYNR